MKLLFEFVQSVGFFFTLLFHSALLANHSMSTTEDVLTAWNKRAQYFSTLSLKCSGHQFIVKEGQVAFPANGFSKTSSPKRVPPEDTTCNVSFKYLYNRLGNQILFEITEELWSFEENRYVSHSSKQYSDNEIHKIYSLPSVLEFPLLEINSANTRGNPSSSIQTLPIGLIFHLLAPSPGRIFVDHVTLVRTDGIHNGKQCWILDISTTPSRSLKHSEQLWVLPSMNFIPVRYLRTTSNVPALQIDVVYPPDESEYPLPVSWTIVDFGKTGLVETSTVINADSIVVNEKLAPEQLSINPAPGTWTNNLITNESYIVKAGGESRPILDGEFNGTNYQDLLRSEPGELNRPEPMSSWTWIFLAMSILGLLFLFSIRYRKRLSSAK